MIIVFRYFINEHLGCSVTATTHLRFQVSIAVNKENLTSKLLNDFFSSGKAASLFF